MTTAFSWRAAACALLLALAGCSDDSDRVTLGPPFETLIKDAEAPPPEALVTERLAYEPDPVLEQRLDVAAQGATVELDPALVAAVRTDALVRLLHVSDVQLREERARLLAFDQELATLPGASLVSPVEEATRPPLLATNSPFMWLGLVLTIDALHAQAPLDLTLHTGDATDVNLKSELWRFLDVADRLDTPMLLVAGNHDVLGWGVWRRERPFLGTRLDGDVEHESAQVAAVFSQNRDAPIMAPSEHRAAVTELVGRLGGPHPPTLNRFGSQHLGYDLAPAPGALYYTVVLREAVPGVRPGVQLIVLETNRDDGGADAQVDPAQLVWLEGVLNAPATQENLVIVAGHHPLVVEDPTLVDVVTVGDLDDVRALLLAHPNVVAYLTGHTHVPAITELEDGGALALVQLNPGALIVYPQSAALVQLTLEGSSVAIEARRFEPMIAPGSDLAARLAESRAAAAADEHPEGPFWVTYRGVKPVPALVPP